MLYMRPRSSRETDEFFRSRNGELWVGRRHTLGEKSTELGLATADLTEPAAALADLAPGRTRVLRGLDPQVDAAVRAYDGRARAAGRDRELAIAISELKLVKDEWEIAQLQDAIDATVRGFEDVARILPADRAVSERLLEGVFGLRARHDGNDVGYSSIVGAGEHATILHWVAQPRRHPPGRPAADGHGRRGPQPLHRRRHPGPAGERHVHRAAAPGLRHRVRLAAGRHRRHPARA